MGWLLKALGIVELAMEIHRDHFELGDVDKVKKLKLELLSEEEKGYESDDPKIELLYKQAAIYLDAAEKKLEALKSRS